MPGAGATARVRSVNACAKVRYGLSLRSSDTRVPSADCARDTITAEARVVFRCD